MASVGLLGTMAYLIWRVGWSMAGVPMWLWIPALVCEVVGFAGTAALVWALWPRVDEPRRADRESHPAPSDPGPVDVVVRVYRQSPADLRATLIALRTVAATGRVIVVDLGASHHIAALALELGADYLATDDDDLNGISTLLGASTTDLVALLEAGDIPSHDLLNVLAPLFDDPLVAIAQGAATSPAGDSAETGADGRHDLRFERSALNPALGRRGAAIWLGSGSVVRRAALESVTVGSQRPLPTQWTVSAALFADGWRIVTAGPAPLVSVPALRDTDAVYDDRVKRSRTARRLLVGPHGAMGINSMPLRQRAALLAWSVRPLSGLHRGLFVAVLVASMLSGRLPLQWTAAGLLWLPTVLATLGVCLLSGWVLRPGDRTRWSLLTIGAAFRGLASPPSHPSGLPPLLVLRTARHGAALVGAVVVTSTVMALRGMSEQVTHTLGPLESGQLVVLMLVGLWLVAMSLDAMRLLARKGQMRRALRVMSSLPAEFGERSAYVVDLTAEGAGVVCDRELAVGSADQFVMVLPTGTGCTTVSMHAVVRNMRRRAEGGWRLGIEFTDPSGAAADALAEHCAIQPARWAMGEEAAPVPVGRPLIDSYVQREADEGRRALLRLAAVVAIVGAAASATPSSADASASARHLVRGAVLVAEQSPAGGPSGTSGLGGVVVMGVCSLDAGADGSYGTTDDAYGPTTSTSTAADGSFDLALEGQACWTSVPPPLGYVPLGQADSVPVDSLPVDSVPVDSVPVAGRDQRVAAESVPLHPVDLGTSTAPRVVMVAVSTPAQPPAAEDVVWADLDADGVHDIAEPGLSGVLVTMYDLSGDVAARATTDRLGRFALDGLDSGLYTVGLGALPAGTSVSSVHAADAAATADGGAALVAVSADRPLRGLSVGVSVSAPMVAASEPSAAGRLLPEPAHGMVASSHASSATPWALLVFLIAGGLGISLVLSFAASRPRWRDRTPESEIDDQDEDEGEAEDEDEGGAGPSSSAGSSRSSGSSDSADLAMR